METSSIESTRKNISKVDDILTDGKTEVSFRCTYYIKDFNPTQILNYTNEVSINEEIISKIKIINNNKKEDLIFTKRFQKLGFNIIDFSIEGQLTNMSSMFNNCSSLKNIQFISFPTSQVNSFNAMFQNCLELEYLDLSNFDTSNIIDMGWMFNNCKKLKEIKGINNFNTSKLVRMSSMFQECNELDHLDLSNFNTKNVKKMEYMFARCYWIDLTFLVKWKWGNRIYWIFLKCRIFFFG